MRMEHYKVLSSIITRCVKLIKDRHGLFINIDSLPSDDADDVEVYELIKTDRSNDVFGFESAECNDRMSLIQPTAFHHIIEFHAMEHPFMCAKFSEYIHKKNNPESVEYHSYVEETVLAETYGVVLYRDQIEKIIHSISGIPEDVSTYIARYIHSNMKPELNVWRPVFIVGAQKNGYSEEKAEQMWEWINTEGEHVSNRMAEECHALTTYRCFWLKTYYPNEYKDALIPTINTTK